MGQTIVFVTMIGLQQNNLYNDNVHRCYIIMLNVVILVTHSKCCHTIVPNTTGNCCVYTVQ